MSVQGHYIAPRVTNLALQYITTGIALSSSWKVMKPHMQSLMANVVFPLCCFDDEDQELWDEDPQEYIRKVGRAHLHPLTPGTSLPDPRLSATLAPAPQDLMCMSNVGAWLPYSGEGRPYDVKHVWWT